MKWHKSVALKYFVKRDIYSLCSYTKHERSKDFSRKDMHRTFWTEVATAQHQVTVGSKELGLQGGDSRFYCTEAMISKKKAICKYICGPRPWNVLRRFGTTSTGKTAVKYKMESDSNTIGQYSHCFPHILLKSCRDVNRKSWDRTRVCECVCNYFITCLCVCVCAQLLSYLPLFVMPWTLDCQALLPMEPCWQEGQRGLVFSYFSIPGCLFHPGIEFTSLVSPALAGRLFTTAPPGKHFGSCLYHLVT